MPAVIGDFEVVAEPPVPQPAAGAAQPAAPALGALDLQRLVEQLREQALRLLAH